MAYYLGYKTNDEFQTIDLNINDANNILSIVKFTCSFNNEEELKEYLFEEGLIQDDNVELSYLIEKGKKGNKIYVALPNIKRIFYKSNSNVFDIDYLKSYIEKNIKDISLVKHLLSNILKKYGIGEHIRKFILDNLSDQNRRAYLISTLKTILANSSIIELNYRIQSLINAIQRGSNILNIEINSFVEFVLSDNDTIVYLYRMLNRQLNIPKVLEIDDLLNIEYIVSGHHQNEIEIRSLIERFINHSISQGQKINSRILVDLGSMIQDYKDYLLNLELQEHKSIYESENEIDDIDEFLEENDFSLFETTSEGTGIKLRQTNPSTWETGN